MSFLVTFNNSTQAIILYSYIVLLTILCFTIVLKTLSSRKLDILSLIVFLISIVGYFIPFYQPFIKIFINPALFVFELIVLSSFYKKEMKKSIIRQKLFAHLKNDSADYYLTFDSKYRIIDQSLSITNKLQLTKKELTKLNGFDILFEKLNIVRINNDEAIKPNIDIFKRHLEDLVNRYKMYEFSVVSFDEGKNKKYHCLMQPVFYKNKLTAILLFMYLDKMNLINEVNANLNQALALLQKEKNVLNILMSLSEGIALYFDYQEKMYYATQSFSDYVELGKRSFTFEEFFNMIVPEDRELYYQQSETVNSLTVTRIKFKLMIKNTIYNAIEDSIYLTKDGGEFVSIIHVTNKVSDYIPNEVLSTKETFDLLKKLSEEVITPIVYSTEEMLLKALKEEEHE